MTFAGSLAGRGVVVVDHGATRTTYEPVTASVSVGDTSPPGDRIGTLQLAGSHCFPRACLHWGWIRTVDDVYLDPLRWSAPVRSGCCRCGAMPVTSPALSAVRGWSGPRMRLLVGPSQPFGGDVGVALRGGQ